MTENIAVASEQQTQNAGFSTLNEPPKVPKKRGRKPKPKVINVGEVKKKKKRGRKPKNKYGFVPKKTQEEISEVFKNSELVKVYPYSGVDHGFARTGGANYDRASAETSDTRTLSILKKALIR